MARRIVKPVNQVVCDRGVTYVDCAYVNAIFRYRRWVVKLNPQLLFPSLRREHRKVFIVNGKKRGWGEVRMGQIPLSKYDLKGSGVFVGIRQFFRKYIGVGLRRNEKGYIYAGIGSYRFVIVQHISKEGLYICEVYDKRTEDQIGNFIFNKEFTEVYPHTSVRGIESTLQVIIGYVADSLVYSRAAGMLQSTIKIIS